MMHSLAYHRAWLTRSFLLLWLSALALMMPAQAMAMTFSPAPGSNLGSFPAGQSLSIPLSVSGGVLPMTGWYECDVSVTYDPSLKCLPTGLTIAESTNSESTTINGTPNVAPGVYSFTLTVFDSFTPATVNYSITITGGPTVTSLSPTSGSTSGGTSVTISGTGFTGATGVAFGGNAATFSVNSDTSITATTPSGSAGTVPVVVTTAAGSSVINGNSQYTYVAPPIAGAVSATVAANSSSNPIPLNLSGGAATSVAVASQASHGTATASGTSITYTPTAGYSGPDSITYTASNAIGTSAPATISFTVSPPTLALSPATLPSGTAGTAYSSTLSASNGSAPYSFSLTSGALPPGLNLSGNTLGGTPSASGTFNFTVTATDSFGATGSQPYALSIAAPTLSLTPTSLSDASAGVPYTSTFNTTGGTAPYSYAIIAGSLPAGLALIGNALSGTATVSGTFTFTVTATDANSFTTSRSYTLTVASPTITVSPVSLSGGIAGAAYSATLGASGGTAPYTFAVTAGALPSGMTLSGDTLSGTPTADGTFNFTVTATDGNNFTGSRAYSLTIVQQPPVAGTVNLSVAANSTTNAVTLNLGGGPVSSVAVVSAASHGTATASGTSITYTPNAGYSGADSFTYTATGPGGTSAPGSVNISVGAPTLVITPGTFGGGIVGSAYSTPLSSVGGTAPYSYSVTAGSLPTGLVLSPAGVLGGTPTNSGSFNLTITATDAYGATGSQAYTLVIADQAPVAGAVSTTVAANSSTHAIPLALSGGPVSSVAISTAPSHGTAVVSGTAISYTPTAGFSGSDSFAYTATGPGGTSAPATVSLSVTAPTLALNLANLVDGTLGTAYSASLGASGGTAPYTYAISTGSLPAGLSLSPAGVLSGTPTSNGSFALTFTVSDAYGAVGSQAHTLVIADRAPIAGNSSATVAANSSANAISLALSGGAATSVTVTSAPAHGSAIASGLGIRYTPSAGYSGSDSFAYTANGPGGTSAPATVTVSVSAPTLDVEPSAGSVEGGTLGSAYRMSLRALGGMAPYRFTLSAGSLPTGLVLDSGSGVISGTPQSTGTHTLEVTVTDVNGAVGTFSFALSIAAQTVTVVSSNEALVPGQVASVDLTQGATGGPFLRARLLSLSPASAGSASLSGPFTLRFAPTTVFAGTAVATFSLENGNGGSATGTVTFTVQARPDPGQDAEVIGVLNAQSRAAERFASTQMDNFNRRLEQLHRPTCDRNAFNASVKHGREDVRLGDLGKALRDELQGNDAESDEQRRKERDSARTIDGECREAPLAFWTDGFINTGSNRARGAKDNSYTTYGLSAGVDYRLSPRTVVGMGVGYGTDRTDVGDHDTHSEGDALGLAAYLSTHPLSEVYVDALLGYNRIRFDSRRYVTSDPSNGYAHGSRDADQWYASLTASYEYRAGALSLAPYARVNGSVTTLDDYRERGGGIYGLSYDEQHQRTFTSFLGLRGAYDIQTRAGVLTPRVGLAWGHNFSHSDDYRMRYTDQGDDGVLYRLSPDPMDSNFIDLDTGLELSLGRSWRLGLSYKTALGSDERNEMFRIGLDGRF
ncbi:putative Ig domain-containing protein [Pseudomonas sp. SWI44]|uniref:putative Ig domain-containing protein n=1 Tax=Pseudomonas sp. SWI44 TaxID=2083053 RepID=UPI001319CE54|nr:putative Ig domain-containing protein [Pseudomonas sp. SWI44]